MVGFGISEIESSGFITRELISSLLVYSVIKATWLSKFVNHVPLYLTSGTFNQTAVYYKWRHKAAKVTAVGNCKPLSIPVNINSCQRINRMTATSTVKMTKAINIDNNVRVLISAGYCISGVGILCCHLGISLQLISFPPQSVASNIQQDSCKV